MHEVADSLNSWPASGFVVKVPPGEIREDIGFAIPAWQQIDEHITWQLFDRVLFSRFVSRVRQTCIFDNAVGGHVYLASWCH
jgi:hypothetical protein